MGSEMCIRDRHDSRKKPNSNYVNPDYHKCKKAINAYTEQQKRTKNITYTQQALNLIDIGLPYTLCIACLIITGVNLFKSL